MKKSKKKKLYAGSFWQRLWYGLKSTYKLVRHIPIEMPIQSARNVDDQTYAIGIMKSLWSSMGVIDTRLEEAYPFETANIDLDSEIKKAIDERNHAKKIRVNIYKTTAQKEKEKEMRRRVYDEYNLYPEYN